MGGGVSIPKGMVNAARQPSTRRQTRRRVQARGFPISLRPLQGGSSTPAAKRPDRPLRPWVLMEDAPGHLAQFADPTVVSIDEFMKQRADHILWICNDLVVFHLLQYFFHWASEYPHNLASLVSPVAHRLTASLLPQAIGPREFNRPGFRRKKARAHASRGESPKRLRRPRNPVCPAV